MIKINPLIRYVHTTLPFLILGIVVADQWRLSEVYFGKDILNQILSLFFVLGTILWTKKYIRFSVISLPIFLILTTITSQLTHSLHAFPDYVSFVNYILLVVLAILLHGSYPYGKKLDKKQPKAAVIVLLSGAAINWFWDTHFLLNYLILASLAIYTLVSFNDNQRVLHKIILIASILIIPLMAFRTSDVIVYPSQKKYYDPVIFSQTTAFQQIDITHWKGNLWYYLNKTLHFSSVDPWLYYEPLVHPVMSAAPKTESVLILGGENGMAVKEVLKYSENKYIDLVPLDTALLSLSASQVYFTTLNEGALNSNKLNIKSGDLFYELNSIRKSYDVIIIDLPDPTDIETNQYYSQEFYTLCKEKLKSNGLLVTQSGSPYFATDAFEIINMTMRKAGFQTVQLHNQVMTAGEWGWTIASKHNQSLDSLLQTISFDKNETNWINNEAIQMMLSFGKKQSNNNSLEINTINKPVLYKYYNEGNWQHN